MIITHLVGNTLYLTLCVVLITMCFLYTTIDIYSLTNKIYFGILPRFYSYFNMTQTMNCPNFYFLRVISIPTLFFLDKISQCFFVNPTPFSSLRIIFYNLFQMLLSYSLNKTLQGSALTNQCFPQLPISVQLFPLSYGI